MSEENVEIARRFADALAARTVPEEIPALASWTRPTQRRGTEQLGLGKLDPELTAHAIIAGAEDAAWLTLTHPRRFPPDRIASFAAELLTAVAR
jgi:hypothetical protein